MLTMLLLVAAAALRPQYAELVRSEMVKQATADWVTVQDAVQQKQLAYTSSDLKHVYVDFGRFKNAPQALANTLKHEIAHTRGATHNDGSPYMSYAVTEDRAGNIVDDAYAL